MKGTMMIEIDKYTIFSSNKMTLQDLSKDDSDKANIKYMTNSKVMAVDFDKAKTIFTNKLALSEEVADSVDAILQTDKGIFFIEFKNGRMKNEKPKVKSKIKDSLLIFGEITHTTIADTRKEIEFILVYNEEKNPMPHQRKEYASPSCISIGKILHEKAKEEFVRFDLERNKGLYFRDVHTYTKEEFQKFIDNI